VAPAVVIFTAERRFTLDHASVNISSPTEKKPTAPRRAVWLISHVFKRIRELKKALSHEPFDPDLIVPSYAAASSKSFINFSSSRAGTDDGRVSGNLLKNADGRSMSIRVSSPSYPVLFQKSLMAEGEL
jgi:hypothetical protein